MGDVVSVRHSAYLAHGRVRGLAGHWSCILSDVPARVPELRPDELPFHSVVDDRPAGTTVPGPRRDVHVHAGRLWTRLGPPDARVSPAGLRRWLSCRESGHGAATDALIARELVGTPLGDVPGRFAQERAPALGRALREDGRDRCAESAAAFVGSSLRVAGDGAYVRVPGPVVCHVSEPRPSDPSANLHRYWPRTAVELVPALSVDCLYGRVDRMAEFEDAVAWLLPKVGVQSEALVGRRWVAALPDETVATDADVALLVRDLPMRVSVDLMTSARSGHRPADPDRFRARAAEIDALLPRSMTCGIRPEEREAALEAVVDLVDALGVPRGARGARMRLADLADFAARYALPRLRETPAPTPDDEEAMAGLGPA